MFLIILLCVATVVGYQIARSKAVSNHVVNQKHSGSVFSIVARTLLTGTTVPSGTARITTGRYPPCLSRMYCHPARLKGSPCAVRISSAISMSDWEIGSSKYSLIKACSPKNTVLSYLPPRDSMYEYTPVVPAGYCLNMLTLYESVFRMMFFASFMIKILYLNMPDVYRLDLFIV